MNTYEILKIDPNDYGLTQEKVNDLIKPFIPLCYDYMLLIPNIEKVKNEFEEKGISNDIENKAKSIAKLLQKLRKKNGETKDEEKRVYRQAGDVIQSGHNMLLKVIEDQEEELEKIIKYNENKEKERVTKLQSERIETLKPFEVENVEKLNLGEMDEIIFNNFLEGAKKSYQDKKDHEESERKRKDEEEKEKEILKKENDKLKKEAEEAKEKAKALEKEKKDKDELIAKNQAENERLKQEEDYKKFLSDYEGLFDKILKEDGKVVLYRKVADFIIPNQN